MPRPKIKQREPAKERADFEASRDHGLDFSAIIKDITGGASELVRQGKAAAANVQAGYRKIAKFVRPK